MKRILVLTIVRGVQALLLIPLIAYPLPWLFSLVPGPIEWFVGLGLLGTFIDAMLIFTIFPWVFSGIAIGLEQVIPPATPRRDHDPAAHVFGRDVK